jgi:hypothetical protein
MNPLIHLKQTTSVFLLVLASFALLPQTQAAPDVVPGPDGCYPGFTTAEGCDALNSLTSGTGNTGIGWRSLFLVDAGSFNTGVGAGTLILNTADSNTAVGAAALLLNTTGPSNTAVGTDALVHNVDGDSNTAVGAFALFNNTTIMANSGISNNAVGRDALSSNTTGSFNQAMGVNALLRNTTGNGNIAIGDDAGTNITGSGNVTVGNGSFAMLTGITSGNNNVCVGSGAGLGILNGVSNTCIGEGAGSSTNTFNGNVYIGQGVNPGAFESDTTRIRNIGNTAQGSNIFVTVDAIGGTKLGYQVSSRRYKEDIKPMDQASESLFALTPVTFHYKKDMDPAGTQQYGLIAEDVAKVSPDLVVNDPEGKPATLRFLNIEAMLLNEFLKEHKKVEAQQASIAELRSTVAQQQKGMEVLTAQLKEQAAQIQKVSAQVAVSKAAPQTVLNNR